MTQHTQNEGMKPVYIEAFDLDDAWFQCLSAILEKGQVYTITRGSYKGQKRLEFDFVTLRVKKPSHQIIPIIPEGLGIPPPTTMEYVQGYLEYLLTGAKTETEDYTYGERLVDPKVRMMMREIPPNGTTTTTMENVQIYLKYLLTGVKPETEHYIYGERLVDPKVREGKKEIPLKVNQVEEIIKMYKTEGYGTNQAIMEIGMPSDVSLKDPPCLRLIDTRIRYGKLHFIPYFRSWDLWGGFPSNLGGLQLVKQYMAEEIGVEDGEIIAISKGLHLYDYTWEWAKQRTTKYDKKIE